MRILKSPELAKDGTYVKQYKCHIKHTLVHCRYTLLVLSIHTRTLFLCMVNITKRLLNEFTSSGMCRPSPSQTLPVDRNRSVVVSEI